ncbi:uncharacterized protein LOC112571267 isoform X1 [Pomacea canaliculata]|uniref:uncharacterized protein LOC112571267 isoform X1 n=1 Tax=Pomacea canaliculata TaxID=400727 RepID=UPI000D725476|nr:uncharacterized protein LOC112571267 isoform X1 [Pomacea canaliculata]
MFLKRSRAEYAALSVLEKQKLIREAATPALPITLEEKKMYLKQLMEQLKKVVKVLLHIGVEYYFEMQLDGLSHLLAHDGKYRNVLAERPSVVSDLKYLRQCVQKILNDAYGRALGREECNVRFPYKKHSLAPVVIVTGMPEGVNLKHPSFYGISTLRKIISKKEMIKMDLIAQSEVGEPSIPQAPVVANIVAQEPSPCAAEVIHSSVETDIFMASDRASGVQNTIAQDIVAQEPSPCAAEVIHSSVETDIFMASDRAAGVQNTIAQDIVAQEPSPCAAEVIHSSVETDIFMASDRASGVQNTIAQDIVAQEPSPCAAEVIHSSVETDMEEAPTNPLQLSTVMKSAKQSREKSQRTGVRTLWSAAEILVVQQHFSQELAGLKPVKRSSIDSFLAQQTVVKRTATALGNYLLRNRKKIRQDDQ